jgi:hypothetical protein
MSALSLRSGNVNLYKFNQWSVADLMLLGVASAPSLFLNEVPNVNTRDRINHRRYQFIWSFRVAALCFSNIFYGLVLQFEQVLITGNWGFRLKPRASACNWVS